MHKRRRGRRTNIMLAPLRINDAQFGLCAKLKTGKMTPIAGSN